MSNSDTGAPATIRPKPAQPPSPAHPNGVPAQPAKNVTLNLRGIHILEAVIADLLAPTSAATPPRPGPSMAEASYVTVGGCSAGGLAGLTATPEADLIVLD
jgi:hypothetical protein